MKEPANKKGMTNTEMFIMPFSCSLGANIIYTQEI